MYAGEYECFQWHTHRLWHRLHLCSSLTCRHLQAATNWSTYAAQFRALEDYTVDGTTTGELDETKI